MVLTLRSYRDDLTSTSVTIEPDLEAVDEYWTETSVTIEIDLKAVDEYWAEEGFSDLPEIRLSGTSSSCFRVIDGGKRGSSVVAY